MKKGDSNKKPDKNASKESRAYEAHKARAAARQKKLSAGGRDIGPLPEVCDPERKAMCAASLRLFLETYLGAKFALAWSPDHLEMIAAIESAVLHGELQAFAMPRGTGKSTMIEGGALWALLYGYRKFAVILGAEMGHAVDMLDNIKADIENNDLLLEDFPEVCFPVLKLDGINNRAGGQTSQGKHTEILWTKDRITLPTIEGAASSGGIIRVAGLTGRIRGMSITGADGVKRRPDLVMPDDPQTDESAKSPSQCETRARILAGAVLGLAGPGKKIAGLMTMTIIVAGDLADRMLDRKKYPQWQGRKFGILKSLPTNERLWLEYDAIRKEGMEKEEGLAKATAFYVANRAEMDAGAVASWEQRFNEDEASAIQHAMNLKLTDEESFWAEYMNEPRKRESEKTKEVTADVIVTRLSGVARLIIPSQANRLTYFIDVQDKLLYYEGWAWRDDFAGWCFNYGTYPDQGRTYFTRREVRKTMEMVHKGVGWDQALYASLVALSDQILGVEYTGETGNAFNVERCLIDSNYPRSTDTVRSFCKRSKYRAMLWPSRGFGTRAKDRPFKEQPLKTGEKMGHHWKTTFILGQRHVYFDTNYWKTFLQGRWNLAGALSLFGDSSIEHRMIGDHLASEYAVRVKAAGREVDEWSLRPGQENDWLDGLVGNAVAASMGGVGLATIKPLKPKPIRRRGRVTYMNL